MIGNFTRNNFWSCKFITLTNQWQLGLKVTCVRASSITAQLTIDEDGPFLSQNVAKSAP